MIDRITGQMLRPGGTGGLNRTGAKQDDRFDRVFREEMARHQALQQQPLQDQPVQSQGINFSKHAISRVEERGIEVTPHLMAQLAGSVSRAQEKGATNILATDGSKAFIINVPTAKVITAITQSEMKENVFTNIDGAVFL